MKLPQILLVVVLAVAATLAASAWRPDGGSAVRGSDVRGESTFSRVMRTRTFRCGYTPYSIGLIKDPNTGNLSGIYFDIVTTLAANLGLAVVWAEEVGWSGQIEGLANQRYDLICSPVSLTAGRARAADFSVPLYFSPVHIWARADDQRFGGDIASLNNSQINISTLDGEQTSTFAKQFFPKANQVSLPQTAPFSDLLLQVTTGKADIVFAEPYAVGEFLTNNPKSLRQLTPSDKPLLVVPNVLLLPQGEYAFKQMIDNGLREMFNSRVIDQILDAHTGGRDVYLRAANTWQ